MRGKSVFVILFGFLLLGINGFVTTPILVAQTRIRIGTPGPSTSYLPIQVAIEEGFFKKRGIEVQYVQMVPAVTPAGLVNGGLDYSTVPAPAAVAAARGLPVRVISFTSVKLQHVLVGRPEIKSVRDLAGKKIGIARSGDLTAFEAKFIIHKYALGPKTALVSVANNNQRLQAVKLGIVDVAILSPLQAIMGDNLGLHRILKIGDILEVPQVGLSSSLEKIHNDRNSVLLVLESMIEGLAYTRSPSHREKVINVIARWVKLNHDEASKVYESVINTFSAYGVPTREQENAYLTMLKATAHLPENASSASMFDFSVCKEAAEELGLKVPK